MSWTCPIHSNSNLILRQPMSCGCYRIECATCHDGQLVMSDSCPDFACRKASDEAKDRAEQAIKLNKQGGSR